MKRSEQKKQTRKKIVESAFIIFEQYGFENAKTLDIANLAGISHGNVFLHFKSKDDLVIKVIREFSDELSLLLHKQLSSNLTVRDYLENLVCVLENHEKLFRNIVLEKNHYKVINVEYAELQYKISLHFYQMLKIKYTDVDLRGYSFIFNLLMGMLLQYILNREYFIDADDESVLKKFKNEIVIRFTEVVEDYVKLHGGMEI